MVLSLALFAAACGGDEASESPSTTDRPPTRTDVTGTSAPSSEPVAYAGYRSEQYADGRNWLCHPDDADENVCLRDLTATAVHADGTTEVLPHEPASDPPIDCFYVYPTISTDPEANSDLDPGENEEIRTVLSQAARLDEICEVYAPVYRQRTLAALLGGRESDPATRDLAYADVFDAWRQYVANDNRGRGVVLVGHSQGAGLLKRLVQEEIDGSPELRQILVSAFLLGTSVGVPEEADVGGDFSEVPLCRAPSQVGCVISYASFRSTDPPPDNSIFGRAPTGQVAACTNPAALEGGIGVLEPYFAVGDTRPFSDPASAAGITTPWVTYPDLLEAECKVLNGFSVLEVTVKGDPADPRMDDIAGDLTPEWGLHLVDANIAMGDIVDVVRAQAGAWVEGERSD